MQPCMVPPLDIPGVLAVGLVDRGGGRARGCWHGRMLQKSCYT